MVHCEYSLNFAPITKGLNRCAKKRELKGKYKKLYYCISAILFENDLQGINFGTNDDEYEPEVGTILPRLPEAETIDDVQRVVYEEFGRWFGEPGDMEDCAIVAKEIWAAWNNYQNGMSWRYSEFKHLSGKPKAPFCSDFFLVK